MRPCSGLLQVKDLRARQDRIHTCVQGASEYGFRDDRLLARFQRQFCRAFAYRLKAAARYSASALWRKRIRQLNNHLRLSTYGKVFRRFRHSA